MKADRLNSELARGTYTKLEQKNITAWLYLRNKAAHAEYDKFKIADVEIMFHGVRNFIITFPA